MCFFFVSSLILLFISNNYVGYALDCWDAIVTNKSNVKVLDIACGTGALSIPAAVVIIPLFSLLALLFNTYEFFFRQQKRLVDMF